MTATIVNLRRARKAKARDDRANEAAANRFSHGRTRSERIGQAIETDRLVRHLDAHLLDAHLSDAHPLDAQVLDADGKAGRQADDGA